ncbi:MAG: helix-turn-helix transcriptional regulator [Opitutae bacterium]|nr:helix-turn-helix transcriptional regulator [Opitutae bacterium]
MVSTTQTFGQRVAFCSERVGNAAELGRRIGVSHTAIGKYQNEESEPSVFTVVRMAAAAEVSLEWLATGQGSAIGPSVDPRVAHSLSGFGSRLKLAWSRLKRRIGLLNVEMPLKETRIQELIEGAKPELEDVIALSYAELLPLNFILHGAGPPGAGAYAERKQLSREYSYADFLEKLRAIDGARRLDTWGKAILPGVSKTDEGGWRMTIFEAFARLYETLRPGEYVLHQISDDSMPEIFKVGDLVLAIAEDSPSKPGFYILESGPAGPLGDNEESRFVARLSPAKNGFHVSFDKPNAPNYMLDPEKEKIVARVVKLIRTVSI